MKKILLPLFALIVFLVPLSGAYALSRDTAITEYQAALEALAGVELTNEEAQAKATHDVDALLGTMRASQGDVRDSFDSLKNRVDSIPRNDSRKDSADSALDRAEDARDAFVGMEAGQNLEVEPSIAGALPRVYPSTAFEQAETRALEALSAANRVMIAPSRPGAVPTGDIVSDFIPQVVRQLFRFAFVAVLIALTVSGVMMVMAQGDEERLTNARKILYFSLIGFACITLAFAIVRGVTDIDFFRINSQ
jgi:branched-subunit amino acid transport protein